MELYKDFYLTKLAFDDLLGSNNPEIRIAIDINANDFKICEKSYPFFNKIDIAGKTAAPAHKLTINLIESTRPLQLS